MWDGHVEFFLVFLQRLGFDHLVLLFDNSANEEMKRRS